MLVGKWRGLGAGILLAIGFSPTARAQDAAAASSAPAQPSLEQQVATFNQQSRVYGAWVVELTEAAEPGLAALRGMGPEFQAAMALPQAQRHARLRTYVERSLRAIDSARTAVAALNTPSFDGLNLDRMLQPAALRQQQLDQLDQMHGLVSGLPALLNALAANDEASAMRGVGELLRGSRLLYETQLSLSRAWLQSAEPASVEMHAATLEVIYYRTGMRLIDGTLLIARRRADPALARELTAAADEIETAVAAMVVAARARKRQMEEIASQANNAEERRLLTLISDIDLVQTQASSLWLDFASLLRRTGSQGNQRSLGLADVAAIGSRLGPLRTALDELALRQAQLLAR